MIINHTPPTIMNANHLANLTEQARLRQKENEDKLIKKYHNQIIEEFNEALSEVTLEQLELEANKGNNTKFVYSNKNINSSGCSVLEKHVHDINSFNPRFASQNGDAPV